MSYYKKAKHSHNEGYSAADILEIALLITGSIISVIGALSIVLVFITV